MAKEKKEVWRELNVYFDWERDLDEIVARLQKIREEHKDKKIRIEKVWDGDDAYPQFQYQDIETDKEFKVRCEDEERWEKARDERERELYEQLKKKFERDEKSLTNALETGGLE